MDAAAELGRNPARIISTRFILSMEMSRLMRDGTDEPVSRDQILRRERGQGNIHFPCSATMRRIGNLTLLISTLAICVTIQHSTVQYIMCIYMASPFSRVLINGVWLQVLLVPSCGQLSRENVVFSCFSVQ